MKKVLIFLSFLGSMIFSTTYAQNSSENLSCTGGLESLQIAKDFNFQLTREADLKPCDQKNLAFRTAMAIKLLKTIAPQLGPGLFTDRDFTNPYDYFKQRVQTVKFPSTCPEFGGAYINSDVKGVMNVCAKAAANSSDLILAALFIHEARHFDGDRYNHAICSHGPRKSMDRCDESIDNHGSYGFELDFFTRVMNSKTLSRELRNEAQDTALMRAGMHFNQTPIFARGSIVKTLDGELRFINHRQNIVIGQSDQLDILFSINNLASIYDHKKEKVFKIRPLENYIEWSIYTSAIRDGFNHQSLQLRDVLFTSTQSCFLYKPGLICNSAKGSDLVQFNSYEGVTIIDFNRSILLEPNSQYLMDTLGNIRKIPASIDELSKLNDDSSIVNLPKGLVGFIPVDEETEIGVVMGGEEMIYHKKSNQWTSRGRNLTQGKVVIKVISDILWTDKTK